MTRVAEDSEFKFIQIEDDDDEIVIQAGAASSGVSVPTHEDADDGYLADGAEGDLADAAREGENFAENEGAPEDAPADETPEEAAMRKQFEHERARRQATAEANRMVTTEEDLKSSVPFAGMQRAIIVAAIALIVVFVVYYQLGGM